MLMVIMSLAQIGLAQHNSVHVIDHYYELSHDDHRDNKDNTNDDCRICHLTDSFNGVEYTQNTNAYLLEKSVHTVSFDAPYNQTAYFSYRSRAPPSFLI